MKCVINLWELAKLPSQDHNLLGACLWLLVLKSTRTHFFPLTDAKYEYVTEVSPRDASCSYCQVHLCGTGLKLPKWLFVGLVRMGGDGWCAYKCLILGMPGLHVDMIKKIKHVLKSKYKCFFFFNLTFSILSVWYSAPSLTSLPPPFMPDA